MTRMALISQDACQDEVLDLFNVSRESRITLQLYVKTLEQWQKRINLVSRYSLDVLWSRHIADALQVAKFIPPYARTVIDLGSGAGIPGLVLAIAAGQNASQQFFLIESNGKKAAFLREVIRLTKAPARVFHGRIEEFDSAPYQNRETILLARALAPLTNLLELSAPFLQNGACALFHKGQDVDSELTDSTKYWNMQAVKHFSQTDVSGCILHITELLTCPTSTQTDSIA